MFWILISLGALAYTFVRIGVLSVTVKVLTFAFVGVALAFGIILLVMLWRNLTSRRLG